ncbi:MAG TPA: sulfotransferase domain-containing protein [Bacteroidia bacterium]|nr:sulfotransferase domain-containing protein [Bacteroidia bacterium]
MRFFIADNTIYIVSYPRSGNTWMRFLIANYFADTEAEFDNDSLPKLIPDIHINPQDIDSAILKPKFIKSHFPSLKEYNNVIYLVRDGRDVAVSYYFYELGTKTIPSDTDFKTYLKKYFLLGKSPFGSWANHIEAIKSQKNYRICFIKYEDLLKDPERKLKEMLLFFNIPTNEEKIKKAVNCSKFDVMQAKYEKYKSSSSGEMDKIHPDKFIRNGKTEDWKNYFDEQILQEFYEVNGKTLQSYGYIL